MEGVDRNAYVAVVMLVDQDDRRMPVVFTDWRAMAAYFAGQEAEPIDVMAGWEFRQCEIAEAQGR